jgi:hypothetical protein
MNYYQVKKQQAIKHYHTPQSIILLASFAEKQARAELLKEIKNNQRDLLSKIKISLARLITGNYSKMTEQDLNLFFKQIIIEKLKQQLKKYEN